MQPRALNTVLLVGLSALAGASLMGLAQQEKKPAAANTPTPSPQPVVVVEMPKEPVAIKDPLRVKLTAQHWHYEYRAIDANEKDVKEVCRSSSVTPGSEYELAGVVQGQDGKAYLIFKRPSE